MQTWSQFPRPRPTLLPEEQIDSLATAVTSFFLCPGVKSPSYEGLLNSTRTLKHVRMSNCKRLWLTPSVLSREKKSSFYKPTMTCFVNSKARLCLWKVLRRKV